VLGLLFADIAAWTLSAAVANIAQGEEFIRLLPPAALAALSSAGAIAAVGALIRRRRPDADGEAPRMVGVAALGFFLIAVIAGAIVGPPGANQASQASTVTMNTENMAFSATDMTAPAGEVRVVIDNHDLWWHTFTIDALQVNLRLPSSGKREITFAAEPGVYEYYCAIPGHDALGMRGTLTVQ
jgi:plastocyanin